MDNLLPSLLFGLTAGAATTFGGLLLFLKPQWGPEDRLLLLGTAGGMMTAAVPLALAWPALIIAGPLPLMTGGIVGWLFVARMARTVGRGALAAVAIGIHNLPEGLALGVAPTTGHEAAFLLLAAIALHNIPEGLAVAAAALAAGASAPASFGLVALSALSEPLGALGGAAAAAWTTAALPWTLGLAAGAMARTILEIWPQPTPRNVALAGAIGATGYTGIWALLTP